MALATIRAETAGFAPISEMVSEYNTDPHGPQFGRYDGREDLGNVYPGDGGRFRGRGFIQLTGRANYRSLSRDLGLGASLLVYPDLANTPFIAAAVLVQYLKDREPAIRKRLTAGDLAGARRLVNGGTHGLDRFTEAYHTAHAEFVDIYPGKESHGDSEKA